MKKLKEKYQIILGYIGDGLFKRAKKQELGIDEQILKNSMIRSLYREFEKQYRSGNPTTIEELNRHINRLEKDKNSYRDKYNKYSNAIYEICNKYNLNREEVKELIRNIS